MNEIIVTRDTTSGIELDYFGQLHLEKAKSLLSRESEHS